MVTAAAILITLAGPVLIHWIFRRLPSLDEIATENWQHLSTDAASVPGHRHAA